MANENSDVFDSPTDFKFPDTPLPDDVVIYGPGQYIGVLGRIKPFYAGRDGKRAQPNDPDKYFANVSQDIWIIQATEDGGTDKQLFVRRITIKDGIVKFEKESSHGVKLYESFPTPQNKLFDKLSWKAKSFYHDFPGVVIGEKGQKKMIWEALKQFYGQVIMFEIVYAQSKGKTYRNIINVEMVTAQKYDAETMAKVETLYDQYYAAEKAAKKESGETGYKKPDTNVDDAFGDIPQEKTDKKLPDLPF